MTHEIRTSSGAAFHRGEDDIIKGESPTNSHLHTAPATDWQDNLAANSG
jgi:hypothetical protein